LIVASELAGRGIDVVVLESGGTACESAIQDLNRGAVIGDAYAGLQATRNRAVGGTAHLWNTAYGPYTGAKYVPLDPWDFEPRQNDAVPGWPLDYTTLQRYYRSAQVHCGLDPSAYDSNDREDGDRRPWSFPQASLLCSRLYQFGCGTRFTSEYVTALHACRNARVRDHATVVRLVAGGADRIGHVQARDTVSGAAFTVGATNFVLAAGAIENARLLLASPLPGLIAGHSWIGRCFMEHPRDWSLRLVPVSRAALRDFRFYDVHDDTSSTTVCGRLALTASAAAALHPPNFSVTLLPDVPAPTGIARYLQRMGVRRDRRGYGWSHHFEAGAFFDRFRLIINFEQRPRPENCVVLARESDALEVPRAELHWRWTAEEQAEWERTRMAIATAIEAAGMGKVVTLPAGPPDPNAHHHAGTTRMGADAASSVVDRDCRVHGTSNLYAAGASVFATAGYANPMLTLVALAIRLAERLHRSSGTRPP
jgi:choline dehydrogenase-like flavoprotein